MENYARSEEEVEKEDDDNFSSPDESSADGDIDFWYV